MKLDVSFVGEPTSTPDDEDSDEMKMEDADTEMETDVDAMVKTDTSVSEPTEPSEEPEDVIAPVKFNVSGKNFEFMVNGEVNPVMKVKEGQEVTVNFTSESGFHDWRVDEFGTTKQVASGGSSSVTFIADKAGTFTYYCSVGSHAANGMKGQFIVE